MGLILQTSEQLRKINLKMDVLAEATLRIKECDLGVDLSDFTQGIGLILEDICIELTSITHELDKTSVKLA